MKKISKLPPLSEAQLEIMNIIWDCGEVTVAQVWKELAFRRKVARNTVLTLITRMEEKGWLRCKSSENAYRYSAKVPRNATMGDLVQRFVDRTFEGSAEELVMALLHGRGVTKEEAEQICRMIQDAKKEKP